MNIGLIVSLFCLYLLIGGGIISIWQAYKIAIRKEYAQIQDRWQNKPNNPEKVAVLVAILHIVEGVVLLLAAAMIFKYGIVNVAKVLFLVMLGIMFSKKGIISRANKQT